MFVFFICLVGFSQTNNSRNAPISYLDDNNPTYAQSEPRVSSNVEITASGVGDCDIGNVDASGFPSGVIGANYLIGVAFTLEEEGTINSINSISLETSSLVQMAVYELAIDSRVKQGTDNTVYYTELPFGDPIPTNASGFISYVGQDFLFL